MRYFNKMLTYRQHVETTALKNKQGFVSPRGYGCKGQHHLFTQYQSVVLIVMDHGLDLTAVSQTNLLKLDKVQNEAKRATKIQDYIIISSEKLKDTPSETMLFSGRKR